MKPRDVERLPISAGWMRMTHAGKGSHRVYRHPTRTGIIVLPWHQSRELAPGTLHNVLKTAGLK